MTQAYSALWALAKRVPAPGHALLGTCGAQKTINFGFMLLLDMPPLNLKIENNSLKRFSSPLITFTGFIVALEICIYLAAAELSKLYSASTETTYILERFEDNGWVVLERDEKTTFDFPKVSVPINTREGDVLVFKKLRNGTLHMYRDEKETARRHRESSILREGILPGPEGDIDL